MTLHLTVKMVSLLHGTLKVGFHLQQEQEREREKIPVFWFERERKDIVNNSWVISKSLSKSSLLICLLAEKYGKLLRLTIISFAKRDFLDEKGNHKKKTETLSQLFSANWE